MTPGPSGRGFLLRAVPSFFLIDATSTQDETDDVVPTGNVVGTIGGYNVLDFFFANVAADLNMPFSNVGPIR
jgi:hypothetical protein